MARPEKRELTGDVLWERQPGETLRAYEAFELYRDMGTSRSYAKVAAQLGKSKTAIEKHAYMWNWTQRIDAYEESLAKERLQKARENRMKHLEMQEQFASVFISLAQRGIRYIDAKGLSSKEIRELTKLGFKFYDNVDAALEAAYGKTVSDEPSEEETVENDVIEVPSNGLGDDTNG